MITRYITQYERLSEVERRNIEQVHRWAAAYQMPGGSPAELVDEIYADEPVVVSVLTDTHVVPAGSSKQAWKNAEMKTATQVLMRKVVFVALHACGPTVTVEGRIEQSLEDGSARGWPFAAVLYFDHDGRIQRDHTYMLPPPHQKEFDTAAAQAAAENTDS